MFGRWLKPAAELPKSEGMAELSALLRSYLSSADEETLRVVAAIVGLLAAVAYADRTYTDAEDEHVRTALARIQGLPSAGVEAISQALRRHAVELSSVELPRYTRDLRELADTELRIEVLTGLVGLAAADGVIATAEVNLLRHVTGAIGLSQADYNQAQAQVRDRLAVLKT